MASQGPNGPSAHTIPSQAPGGLSSPHSEVTASSGTHVYPSGSACVQAEYQALSQDPTVFDPQHDPRAATSEFDAFITSFLLANPEVCDNSRSSSDTGIEQAWVNEHQASLGERSLPVSHLKRHKRTASLSPSPGFAHKVCGPTSHF
jgi:hypothetical protein